MIIFVCSILILQKDCTIELDANTRNGYRPGQKYRVTLMVDDYPRYDVFMNNKIVTPQQKMSSTPVQVTITVTELIPKYNMDNVRYSLAGKSIRLLFK